MDKEYLGDGRVSLSVGRNLNQSTRSTEGASNE